MSSERQSKMKVNRNTRAKILEDFNTFGQGNELGKQIMTTGGGGYISPHS